MKLSLKMFFGICIPAVISCLVIAAFLIEKNLDENIDAEIQIAIKNVEKIENRIKYNVNSTILFKSAEKSNTEKNVKIYYYNNNQLEYETSEVLQSYADEFKTTENNKYIAQQKEINDKNYIFVSTKMGEDKTIVYIEDIDYISFTAITFPCIKTYGFRTRNMRAVLTVCIRCDCPISSQITRII